MEKSIIIAGSGGQGILLFGRLIAHTLMIQGRNVTYFPSYGAEIRGGTANCSVILSDDLIGSPAVMNPDILIVFNCQSLERFLPRLKKGGILFYDSSLISDNGCGRLSMVNETSDFHSVGVEASGKAAELGSIKYANMVMFGAFLEKTRISDLSRAEKALRALIPERHAVLIPENLKAIKVGYEL
ncbi:MAG: 2-oxoacid:ferredoxin oxidoreductase subunit gamma [Nitrospirae bacterium]|nr:2-oxoacid:ferredoxin oxidoreductase subunit gamma [Nitrospirota bacterium]